MELGSGPPQRPHIRQDGTHLIEKVDPATPPVRQQQTSKLEVISVTVAASSTTETAPTNEGAMEEEAHPEAEAAMPEVAMPAEAMP